MNRTSETSSVEPSHGPAASLRPGRVAWLGPATTSGLAGALTVAVCAAQGGYFPPTWGWSAACILSGLCVWAIVSETVETSRVEILQLGALGCLVCWTAVSTAWSIDRPASVLEAERALLFFAVLFAVSVAVKRKFVGAFLGGLACGGALVCLYSTATRLFPNAFGSFDPAASYRLEAPIGYWNGLGSLAAIVLLLCLGLVADEGRAAGRCLAAAATPGVAAALYFTFSRGSWAALALGALATLAISPRRERVLLAWTAVVWLPAAVVAYATTLAGLTHRTALLDEAVADGRRLAVVIVVASLASAACVVALTRVESRLSADRIARVVSLAVAGGAVIAAVGVVATGTVHPSAIVDSARATFATTTSAEASDLNDRLLSLSSNGRSELWQVAIDDFKKHPVAGSGAGSYERVWLGSPRSDFFVRDAHSLYLETLAELGVVGLVLVASVLALPLAAAVVGRHARVTSVAVGAYVAYVAHAAADWDWELAGVTALALAVGGALVIGGFRPSDRSAPPLAGRWRIVIVALAAPLAVAALYGWLGNGATSRAQDALDATHWSAAVANARRADGLMPWSPEPLLIESQALLGSGDRPAARAAAQAAVARDRGNWESWYDLALASAGRARAAALLRAAALYPKSQQIEDAQVKLR